MNLKELIDLLSEYCNQYPDLQGAIVPKCSLCPFDREDGCPLVYVVDELNYQLENSEKE